MWDLDAFSLGGLFSEHLVGPLIHGTAEGDRENRNRELRSAMHSISAEKGMYSVAQPSLPYSLEKPDLQSPSEAGEHLGS